MGSPKAVKRAGDCCPNNPPTIPPNNPPQSLFKISFGLRGIGGLFIVKNYQALNILLIATIPQAPDRPSLFIIRVSGDCCGGLLGDCWLYNPPGAGSPGGRDPQKTPPAGALAGTRPPPPPRNHHTDGGHPHGRRPRPGSRVFCPQRRVRGSPLSFGVALAHGGGVQCRERACTTRVPLSGTCAAVCLGAHKRAGTRTPREHGEPVTHRARDARTSPVRPQASGALARRTPGSP